MSKTFRTGLVQFTALRETAANLDPLTALVRDARAGGADFILLPENANFLEPVAARAYREARTEADDALLARMREMARETGAWILLGSVSVRAEDGDKRANRSILLDAGGEIVARYDKIHLFDVDVGDGQVYRESAVIRPGARAVVADTPWGRVGLSVCYDLRFPHLYRALAKAGADMLLVPAAFTKTTGEAHWHTLLRARAIETGSFVLAPAQCGTHAEGRQTFGHSLVVDPWGKVVADGGTLPGVTFADIDPGLVAEARRKIPALSHDRPFDGP